MGGGRAVVDGTLQLRRVVAGAGVLSSRAVVDKGGELVFEDRAADAVGTGR